MPLRRFFESIAYAGLKPTPHGQPEQRGRLQKVWDRLLTGGPSPSDPLYLSNRTWKQKVRLAVVVVTPLALVVGLAAYVILMPPRRADKAPAQMTPQELAAKTAFLPKDFQVVQDTNLQVTEVTVEKTADAAFVVGTLKNNTARSFASADMTFDLTDENGSQVEAASGQTSAIAPNGTVRFRIPIQQRKAAFVLVREVRGSL